MVSKATLKSFLSAISVEPLILINMIGMQIYGVATNIGVYHVVCKQLYYNDSSVDCDNTNQLSKDVEDKVQIGTADFQMAQSLAYLIPAVFADILLSAWSDKHGRKINLMLSIMGSVVMDCPYTIIFTYPLTPLWILILANAFAGGTGAIGMIMVASYAYLADHVRDNSKLATRMIIFSTCQMLATIVGNFIATQLSKVTSYAGLIAVDSILETIGFFYVLFRLRQIPPEQLLGNIQQKPAEEEKTKQETEGGMKPNAFRRCTGSLAATFKDTGSLLVGIKKTFTKPRNGYKRSNLWLMNFTLFFSMFGYVGVVMYALGLYVQRRPLYWNDTTYARFQTFTSIANLIGNILGAVIMKRFLKLKDTTMLTVSLVSAGGSLVIFAFADISWLLYVSASVGLLNGLIIPAATSLITQQVERDEVGKAYAGFGLSTDVALMLSQIMVTSVYSSTVDWFPGFVFLVGTAILIVCVITTIWVSRHGGDE